MASEQQKKPLGFYLHDDIWTKSDWTIEPEASLEQLYLRRAQELRAQYDYLVLHFSGGYDSGNVLEICMKHNVIIDELYLHAPLSVASKNINDKSCGNMPAETWFTSFPLAQHAKDTVFPNIKITVQDTTTAILDFWSRAKHWHEDFNISDFSPMNGIKQAWDDIHPDLKPLIDRGLKIAHIFGIEKPMVCHDNGFYYMKFLDHHLNAQFPYRSFFNRNQLPQYFEPFYWGDSCADMLIKQGHTIKNYIIKHRLDPGVVLSQTGTAMHHWIGRIVYDRKLPLPFYPDKDTVQVKGMDQRLFKDQNTSYYRNWKSGVDYLRTFLPAHWVGKDVDSGLIGVWSRSYCLGA